MANSHPPICPCLAVRPGGDFSFLAFALGVVLAVVLVSRPSKKFVLSRTRKEDDDEEEEDDDERGSKEQLSQGRELIHDMSL